MSEHFACQIYLVKSHNIGLWRKDERGQPFSDVGVNIAGDDVEGVDQGGEEVMALEFRCRE